MRSSFTVGVVKWNVSGAVSLRPLIAVADSLTETEYLVAKGSGREALEFRNRFHVRALLLRRERYVASPAVSGFDGPSR